MNEKIKREVAKSQKPVPDAMTKRRSFDIVYRRAKSFESLIDSNKKSITDLFYNGLRSNDGAGPLDNILVN